MACNGWVLRPHCAVWADRAQRQRLPRLREPREWRQGSWQLARRACDFSTGGDPSLVFVDEAQIQTAAKEQHKGTSSKGRLHYMLAVSLSRLLTLPAEWQAVPAAMKVRREAGDTRAPSLYIQDRMTQKLGQYILVMAPRGPAQRDASGRADHLLR